MKTVNINYMTYDELIRDIPDILPYLKPYNPTNDDTIRGKVIDHLAAMGFIFGDDIPDIRVKYTKRKERYRLMEFCVEYKELK